MIRATDLFVASPLLPASRSASAAGTRPADAAPAWFDGDTAGSDTRITPGQIGTASRGLSVAQHASLVLGHLCASVDERA